MKKSLCFSALLLCIFLAACGTPQPAPQTNPPTAAANPSNGYPAADPNAAAQQAYPDSGYPSPVAMKQPDAADMVPFKLNKPLAEGAIEISGTGMKDLPLVLLDISKNGKLLGETTVQADGKFSFKVEPLPKDHRLGILLGETKGTRWENLDFGSDKLQGSEPQLVPNIGYFFDTVQVNPKP